MEIYVPEEHIIEMENNQSLINEQEDIELIDKSLNIQLMEFEKSQREVAQIIEMTQPDIVMVELCQSRINILSLNENTLMKEASQLNFEKLRSVIKAVIYIYLIYRNIPSDKILCELESIVPSENLTISRMHVTMTCLHTPILESLIEQLEY
ncbi:unnamed protein product, partial [Rotaria sordida]